MRSVYYFFKKIVLMPLLTCTTIMVHAAQLTDLPDLREMLADDPSLLAVNGTPLSLSYTDNFEAPPSEGVNSSWLCVQAAEDESDQKERKRSYDSSVFSNAKRAKFQTAPKEKPEERKKRAVMLSRFARSIVMAIGPRMQRKNGPSQEGPTQLERLFAARRRALSKRESSAPCVEKCDLIFDAWNGYKNKCEEHKIKMVGAHSNLNLPFFTAVEQLLAREQAFSRKRLSLLVKEVSDAAIPPYLLQQANAPLRKRKERSSDKKQEERERCRKNRAEQRKKADTCWQELGIPPVRSCQRNHQCIDLNIEQSPIITQASAVRVPLQPKDRKSKKRERDALHARRARFARSLLSQRLLDYARNEGELKSLAALQALVRKREGRRSRSGPTPVEIKEARERFILISLVWDALKTEALKQGSIVTLQNSFGSSPVLRDFLFQVGDLLVKGEAPCHDSLEQIAKDILEKAKTAQEPECS